MKRVWFQNGLWFFLAVCLLTGCGGEYAGVSEKGAVSGSSVSGSAVSGSAIEEKKETEEKSEPRKYTFCNDRNLYYRGVDEMTERSLEDGSERKIEVKNIKRICYVDNAWVYYTKETEVYDPDDGSTVVDETQVWRAPVEKENRWQMNEQREELILEDKEGFACDTATEGVWCDGVYVVYVSDETNQYRQFNIAEKKFESSSLESEDYSEDYMGELVVCGGSAFVVYQEMGLIRKKLESDEVETVFEGDGLIDVTATETDVFWSAESKDKGNSDNFGEIWMCSAAGEKRQLVTTSEIKQLLQKEKVTALKSQHFGTHGMFVRENHLYIQLFICGDETVKGENAVGVNMVVLRKELDPSGKLCLEKKLTQCLENPEENQQVFSKFLGRGTSEYIYRSRGLCMYMTEDICLMYVENTQKKKNMWACYDFTTGKFRYITKKDSEWYLMYYDRYNTFHTGNLHEDPLDFVQYMDVIQMLPNNYDA